MECTRGLRAGGDQERDPEHDEEHAQADEEQPPVAQVLPAPAPGGRTVGQWTTRHPCRRRSRPRLHQSRVHCDGSRVRDDPSLPLCTLPYVLQGHARLVPDVGVEPPYPGEDASRQPDELIRHAVNQRQPVPLNPAPTDPAVEHVRGERQARRRRRPRPVLGPQQAAHLNAARAEHRPASEHIDRQQRHGSREVDGDHPERVPAVLVEGYGESAQAHHTQEEQGKNEKHQGRALGGGRTVQHQPGPVGAARPQSRSHTPPPCDKCRDRHFRTRSTVSPSTSSENVYLDAAGLSAWRSRRSRDARKPRRRGRPCRSRQPCPRRAGRRPSCCRPRRRS